MDKLKEAEKKTLTKRVAKRYLKVWYQRAKVTKEATPEAVYLKKAKAVLSPKEFAAVMKG